MFGRRLTSACRSSLWSRQLHYRSSSPRLPGRELAVREGVQRAIRAANQKVVKKLAPHSGSAGKTGRAASCLESAVKMLEGTWVDEAGLEIRVCGGLAHYGNEAGQAHALSTGSDGDVCLRDGRLTLHDDLPVWDFGSVQQKWVRAKPKLHNNNSWEDYFRRYKSERLNVRRQLHRVYEKLDLEKIPLMQSAWQGGMGFAMVIPQEHRQRLLEGKFIVPGSCVLHHKLRYRAVVLACEPWCTATPEWRASHLSSRSLRWGEEQPFYHCIVDERDRDSSEELDQVAFLAEEEIQSSDFAFPVQSSLQFSLLLHSEVLGAYLPNKGLVEALQAQRLGRAFKVPIEAFQNA
eukprot:TRINITY_DN9062_c0_g1_i1.p1 TRINITY_DN9062_c0_g1~~TRINITY_DN9062_c0_g1_i1.p1  ORF type:complete len:367 (+),score=62.99 TRINITY_DN9062_c0_g1_i1:60-1103(+)